MGGIFDSVIDAKTQALLRRERELLVELRETLEREQVDDKRRVEELLAGLDDLFTIVVVGEFNAGKSSLINALFGAKLRVEGPIPVDDHISILRHGEQELEKKLSDFVSEHHYPIGFLRNITLVDTPGTNSIVKRHQEITHDFIPRADLVLFVTSIDRPLSESERQFLDYIREWGKKVVFVVNKIDTKTDEEIEQVLAYLRTNIQGIFGFEPTIFPVAAKLALESKGGTLPPREWTRSRFETLEDYIFKVLSEKERVRIKLTAPLETILSLSKKQTAMIESRRQVLARDMARIDRINEQLLLAEDDMLSNFQQFVMRIDTLLLELERRGVDFLDRYIRVQHLMLLRDALKFRDEFERQVFLDWQGSIDRTIQESVDWLVRQNMRLWNDTVGATTRSELTAPPEELVGKVGREFAYNRDEIYNRMRAEADRRTRTYDVSIESRNTIEAAMRGVFQSFGLGAGALGLGYFITSAFSSVAVDVTGLTAATMLLVTSFLILPYKRSKAKTDFRDRIEQLRSQLRDALDRESREEITRMVRHIESAFEPYRRFYSAESVKIEAFAAKLGSIGKSAREIVAAIEAL